ncbi:MAG: holo-ACP synthase [Acidimicrobiia bacterium]
MNLVVPSGTQIVGIGSDLVDIDRFRLAYNRRVGLAERLFNEEERAYAFRHVDPVPRLAARFAAKEAVMKALGVGLGAFGLRDVAVARARSGAPSVALSGAAAALAAEQGVRQWYLTLSHSDLVALAVAVAAA